MTKGELMSGDAHDTHATPPNEPHRIGRADDFFTKVEIATEEVYVPALKRYYICRGLRQDQVARVGDLSERKPHLRNPLYLMYGVVDADGKPVFRRDQLEDLARQPAANMFPLITAIIRLSGLNITPEDRAKDREAFLEAEDDDF
ncbi:MAG: hypothetical protein LC793_12280 [Thermomicrobia bacterium]|nr:hypothetical protein [Thermomicrobia bacterium]MCA1722653.1 hypothetical protein [Thermomicrobia bacterium]